MRDIKPGLIFYDPKCQQYLKIAKLREWGSTIWHCYVYEDGRMLHGFVDQLTESMLDQVRTVGRIEALVVLGEVI